MHATITNEIIIRGASLTQAAAIERALTIPNPAFDLALRAGRYTGNLSPRLEFFRVTRAGDLILPRGFGDELVRMFPDIAWTDQRLVLPGVNFEFGGQLRGYQTQAVNAMLARSRGVLQAGTGAGKTVMAMAIIAARKQPCLVLVHNAELLNQWRDRARQFLGIDAGRIGGGKFEVKPLTIGIINTVRNRLGELAQHFGQIVVDECHRCPSAMFTEAVNAFPAKYRLGLSATPYRSDGLTKAIGFFIGPKVHEVDANHLREIGAILKPEVITRQTGFTWCGDQSGEYQRLLSDLTQDETRNALIAQDVKRELAREAGTALVVSDRVGHLEALAACLRALGEDMVLLTGKTPTAQREAIVERTRAGKVRVLGSTVQLIGEGFDAPGLASLFLATPIKFSGRLLQVVGRVLRPQAGKVPRVFDYIDPVGVLTASAKARAETYRRIAA
ncbi:MAG: DEAD/DEAH box helicase [Deltaproteobacteria bacterium]|nr:DEAD/DEAH box helicase [Deltaproteobacteria bacterium]